MRKLELNQDCALVLQQVHDNGEEDFIGLAEELHLTPGRLAYAVQELARKKLIVSRNAGYGIWIRLSSRGKQFVHALWPEIVLAH